MYVFRRRHLHPQLLLQEPELQNRFVFLFHLCSPSIHRSALQFVSLNSSVVALVVPNDSYSPSRALVYISSVVLLCAHTVPVVGPPRKSTHFMQAGRPQLIHPVPLASVWLPSGIAL